MTAPPGIIATLLGAIAKLWVRLRLALTLIAEPLASIIPPLRTVPHMWVWWPTTILLNSMELITRVYERTCIPGESMERRILLLEMTILGEMTELAVRFRWLWFVRMNPVGGRPLDTAQTG